MKLLILWYILFMSIINIAQLHMSYEFANSSTHLLFTDYLTENNYADIVITLSQSELSNIKESKHKDSVEFYYILDHLCNTFLKFNRVFYHGVALRLFDKTYLITASSGVGKTTQYKNLKIIDPDHVTIINGDKPILQFVDNSILLYSSPWMGKEKLGINTLSKLDGIIVLSQNNKNLIRQLKHEEAIVPLMMHFLYHPDNLDDIKRVCEMTESLIGQIPIWFFENTGTIESSKLLYNTLINYKGIDYE